jgi:hypothetical protein
VSKLCCPVCWDFFKILQDDVDKVQFTVRGHHYALSMQYLPSWLPEDVLKKMVAKYRDYLRDELLQMMSKERHRKLTHKRVHSFESDGGLSVSSDSSNEDEHLGFEEEEEVAIRGNAE